MLLVLFVADITGAINVAVPGGSLTVAGAQRMVHVSPGSWWWWGGGAGRGAGTAPSWTGSRRRGRVGTSSYVERLGGVVVPSWTDPHSTVRYL